MSGETFIRREDGFLEPAIPLNVGIRRRCFWCVVTLRWWQLNACRACKQAIVLDRPSAPFYRGSRYNGQPDKRRRFA